MGISSDGQLSYGIVFEEGFIFPWDNEEFDGDIGDWWMSAKGFVNPIENPFDEAGNYKPGIKRGDPIIETYFSHRLEWTKANPIPVEVVNYCSHDEAMYLLASRHIKCHRGYPEQVYPSSLLETEEAHQRLISFLEEFGIQTKEQPAWWLTSFMG